MPGYTTVFAGVWDDDALEGLPFEAKGFFVYLFTNPRIRPSGIYRASDDQLVADTDLTPTRVREHLKALVERGRIIRDGSWLFVVGYLKRQPKHPNLLLGARRDVEHCTSLAILDAFAARYPLYSKWLPDPRPTVAQPSGDLSSSSSSSSSSSTSTSLEPSGDGSGSPPLAGPMGPAATQKTQTQNELDDEARARIIAEARAMKQRFAPSAARDVPPREPPSAPIPRGL